jgi:group I intron endonuclease
MVSGIYQIRNTANNRIYIGSSYDISSRIKAHKNALRRGDHRSVVLQRSWNKYGKEAFEFTTLILCDQQNLLMYEQLLIDAYKPIFNMCKIAGSTIGVIPSEETRGKMKAVWASRGMTEAQARHLAEMSAANIGRKHAPLSDKRKAEISASLLGKTHSAETRMKRSKAMSGILKTEEHKRKIGEAHKGKKREPFSDEWKRNMGLAQKGKTHTEESKKKMSDIHKARHKKKKELCV